jgi:hypothetical protein
LLFGLHAFGDGVELERVGQADHRTRHSGPGRVLGVQRDDEVAVDLQHLDRKVREM